MFIRFSSYSHFQELNEFLADIDRIGKLVEEAKAQGQPLEKAEELVRIPTPG